MLFRSNLKDIQKEANHRNVKIDVKSKFTTVVIAVKQWTDMSFSNVSLMEFALKNLAAEMLTENGKTGQIIHFSKFYLLAIIPATYTANSESSFKQRCTDFINASNQHLKCSLTCYIGKESFAHELCDIVDDIITVNRKSVTNINTVIVKDEKLHKDNTYRLPSVEELVIVLQKLNYDAITEKLDNYFEQMRNSSTMDINGLVKFQQQFIQAIYMLMYNKGIQETDFINNDKSVYLLVNSYRSIDALQLWAYNLTDQAIDVIHSAEPYQSSIERVKVYIAHHLDETLLRDHLASFVFLSPDHLSRIFKKETGYSLNQYIIKERIKTAKALLAETDLPIREIALATGCINTSRSEERRGGDQC